MYFLMYNNKIINQNGIEFSNSDVCKILNEQNEKIDYLKYRTDNLQSTIESLINYNHRYEGSLLHWLYDILEQISKGDIVASSIDEDLFNSYTSRQKAQIDLLNYLIALLQE